MFRIDFKLCMIMYGIHTGRYLAYLRHLQSSRPAAQQLACDRLPAASSIPRLRTKFGERAFSHAGPMEFIVTWHSCWSQPCHVQETTCTQKTHLLQHLPGLWSRSRRLGLETYQRLVSVSSRQKLATSRYRPFTSRAQNQFSAKFCRPHKRSATAEKARVGGLWAVQGQSKSLISIGPFLSKAMRLHIRE